MKPGCQAGVGFEERLHFGGIARHDDHDLVAVVLHVFSSVLIASLPKEWPSVSGTNRYVRR